MAAPRPKFQVTFHPEDAADAAEQEQQDRSSGGIATTIAPGARWFFAALALAVLAIAAAAPALSGKFLPQDDLHVTENTALRLWQGLVPIWRTPQRMDAPYPITFTSYLLQYRIFRDSPVGYHAVSLMLHAGVVLLLWTLLRKLELPGAWVAAALFAVHPVPIATVAWISQQKVLLCAAFYLVALLLYTRYCGINPDDSDEKDDYRASALRLPRSRAVLYGLSMLALLLALASQAIAVTFVPVVLTMIAWKRARITRDDLRPLIFPAIVIAIAALFFAVIELRHGAQGSTFPSVVQRLQLLGRVFWFDLTTVLAPVRLSYVYPRWSLAAGAIGQYLPTLAAIGALIAIWRLRREIGRGPLAATALFCILILPYAGIVNFRWMQQSYVGDHLIYLASAVPLIALASFIARRARAAIAKRPLPAFAMPAAAALVIALLLVTSFVRAREYQDRKSLWTATLARNPRLVAAHNALGLIAMEKDNNTAAAFRHFKSALELDDENVETHLYLAGLYASTAQTDLAAGEYFQVLHRDPNRADAHFGLALIYDRQGSSRAAIEEYRRVLEISPDHARAYLNLGQLHERRDEIDDAMACYRKAIALDPRLVLPRLNLALAMFRMGQIEAALDEMKIIVEKIDPRNFVAFMNLGAMTTTFADHLEDPAQKRTLYVQAAKYFGNASFVNRESAEAVCQRGVVLMKQSQLESRDRALLLISEAITCFNRAAELKPDFAQAIQFAQSAQIEREKRQAVRDEPAGGPVTK
ncbi:tetratricopeptide repeat protein [soil metagenome]